MRINEYDSLDDFIFEYAVGKEFSWQNSECRERHMGIEFENSGIYYRMCREPFDEQHSPILENGEYGIYNVMIINCERMGYPIVDCYESIGWYDSLESLLNECMLGMRKFKEVIMDDDTSILGKD